MYPAEDYLEISVSLHLASFEWVLCKIITSEGSFGSLRNSPVEISKL
jgi:hypothetical protein